MTKTGRVPGPQRIRPDCLAGAQLMLANAQIRADRGTAPEARAQGFGNKAEPLSLPPRRAYIIRLIILSDCSELRPSGRRLKPPPSSSTGSSWPSAGRSVFSKNSPE